MLPFSSLIVADPTAARVKLLAAYRQHRCLLAGVAREWGTTASQMSAWVGQLRVKDVLQAIADEARRDGWHHGRDSLGGRPKGSIARKTA